MAELGPSEDILISNQMPKVINSSTKLVKIARENASTWSYLFIRQREKSEGEILAVGFSAGQTSYFELLNVSDLAAMASEA